MQTSPKPDEIDELAQEYLELKGKALEAALAATKAVELATAKGNDLKDLVKSFGSSHAEKSKILTGLEYELMCTYGQTSSTDAAAVDLFRGGLQQAGKTRLISKIFEKTTRWTLRSEASEIIRGNKLGKKLTDLWAKCILLKDKTPVLDVRPTKKAAA